MNSSKTYLLTIFLACFAIIGDGNAAEEKVGGEVGETIIIPAEVQPFIPSGFYPIYLKEADLNADKLPDYLMVLEDNKQKGAEDGVPNKDAEETDRPLVILQRSEDGKLAKVKENDKVISCRICGGIFGDPFDSIAITKEGFIARMYGGSSWRWSYDYEFAYSRRDKTWQLIHVTEKTFNATSPEDVDIQNFVPPKDFGKIDLADFDPENFTYPDSSEPTE